MTPISTDTLSRVIGAQQAAPAQSPPKDILRARAPARLPPADPVRAELEARKQIVNEILQARPWMTVEQAKDPAFIGAFMQEWQ